MRNLKKVLALALATVMLLGMMAMASAADFTDEALIDAKYDTAVDVMQAIGVFNGSKGYLNPKNTLTRAEAAKVITYLALTKTNADKLGAAEAPFADVEVDNWAAGSIGHCKNLGIVSGKGDNKFDPAGTLTGYEFAKMLLVVLGYQANTYKGAGWDTNVNLDAVQAGLLKGLNIDLGAAILREEAAQMAFNALNAQCVAFSGGTVLETGDTKITVGAVKTELKDDSYESYTPVRDGKLQLAEKLYPTLKLSAAADNDFGYNVKTWKYNNKPVATQKDYTVVASYAGTAATLTKGAAYNIFGEGKTIAVYNNGADAGVFVAAKGETANAGLKDYAGALVEIVKNNDGTGYEVITSVAQAAKVTKVVAATATADRYVEVDYNLDGTKDDKITTEAYAKDQYILVYLNKDNKIIKHEAAETVYGTLTQTGKTDNKVTTLYLDGTAIPAAGKGANDIAAEKTLNQKYTVVLANGYAVYAKADDPAKATLASYVYVNKVADEGKNEFGVANGYKSVEVVYMDGTVETVKAATAATSALEGTIVKMAEKDGKKTFDAVADPFATFSWAGADLTATTKAVEQGANKAYFNADSKMLVITKNTNGMIKSAKVVAVPYAVTVGESEVIYTTDTAGNKEVAMIVTTNTVADTAVDLYYVVNTEIGRVYVAATNKTYKQITAYEVKTGAKMTVMVALDEADYGFCAATVDANGVYAFSAKTAVPAGNNKDGIYTITAADASLYNGMISVAAAEANIVDLPATEANFVDLDADASDFTVAKLAGGNAKFTGWAYVAGGKVVTIIVTDFVAAT